MVVDDGLSRRVDAFLASPEGHNAILGDLVEAMWPSMLRYVENRVGRYTDVDAENIAADAVVKVVRGWPTVDASNGKSITSWVFAVTRNTMLDALRRAAVARRIGLTPTAPRSLSDPWTDSDEAAEGWDRDDPRDDQDVEALATARADLPAILDAIALLGVKGEHLMEFLGGAGYDDIATRHGLKRSCVKARLRWARVALREQFGEWA